MHIQVSRIARKDVQQLTMTHPSNSEPLVSPEHVEWQAKIPSQTHEAAPAIRKVVRPLHDIINNNEPMEVLIMLEATRTNLQQPTKQYDDHIIIAGQAKQHPLDTTNATHMSRDDNDSMISAAFPLEPGDSLASDLDTCQKQSSS